jgi:aryl-alcohol dehydrogenase-like predicted oxidoreductase
MELRPLGSIGWNLSRIGLGTMPLAIQARLSEDHGVRVIHRALEGGINWLDTADSYCLDDTETGYGERLVARALREWSGDRDRVMVMSKAGCLRPNGVWVDDGKPARLKLACERSLKALGVSSIPLYLLHAPDKKTPFIESLGALFDLQREGKIQHVGLSNVDVGHIKEAQSVGAIRMVLNRHNIFDQFNFTNGVIDYCASYGIPFVAHSVLGGHMGHVRADESPVLKAVGARNGLNAHQVCLIWLLARSPHIFAIPGALRIESLESNLAALDRSLSAEDMAEVSTAFPPGRLSRLVYVRVRNELRLIGRRVRHRLAGARVSDKRAQ